MFGAPQLPHIRRYVVLTDAEHMPRTSLPGAVDYGSWLAEADGDFAWAAFGENTAAGLCYTSGRVVIGGSACPRVLTEAFASRGVRVVHAWGMTETSPMGTLCSTKPTTARLDAEGQIGLQRKQGFPSCLVDVRIVGDDGAEKPWDGVAFGNLQVRGPAVARAYFRAAQDALTSDGWFDTGDVATIDAAGYMQIVDRSKDVIKSGDEIPHTATGKIQKAKLRERFASQFVGG
ncbi:AMP-binding protein [Falsiroseomonas sp. HW251]|uniref:AMP-binding protein n=1 Tax=Falsiroseomonas sp. HW251 TaxID=3390998 RepID=UPI003D31AE7B